MEKKIYSKPKIKVLDIDSEPTMLPASVGGSEQKTPSVNQSKASTFSDDEDNSFSHGYNAWDE